MFSQDRRKKGQELASKQLASHFASGKNDEALEAFAALEEVRRANKFKDAATFVFWWHPLYGTWLMYHKSALLHLHVSTYALSS